MYAVGSLTMVRMLPVALAMLGTGMRRVTVGFLGWFGPCGLAGLQPLRRLVRRHAREHAAMPERATVTEQRIRARPPQRAP